MSLTHLDQESDQSCDGSRCAVAHGCRCHRSSLWSARMTSSYGRWPRMSVWDAKETQGRPGIVLSKPLLVRIHLLKVEAWGRVAEDSPDATMARGALSPTRRSEHRHDVAQADLPRALRCLEEFDTLPLLLGSLLGRDGHRETPTDQSTTSQPASPMAPTVCIGLSTFSRFQGCNLRGRIKRPSPSLASWQMRPADALAFGETPQGKTRPKWHQNLQKKIHRLNHTLDSTDFRQRPLKIVQLELR